MIVVTTPEAGFHGPGGGGSEELIGHRLVLGDRRNIVEDQHGEDIKGQDP
jgi:hypothetical protein